MKKIQYDIALVVLVIGVFTLQLVYTLSHVHSSYHYFVILFYIIGIALLLLITFRAYDITIDWNERETEESADSDELESKEIME